MTHLPPTNTPSVNGPEREENINGAIGQTVQDALRPHRPLDLRFES